MKEHQRIQELLVVYRDLSGADRRRVEQHVQDCADCAANLAAYQAMDRDLASLSDLEPDERLRMTFYGAMDADGWLQRQVEDLRSLLRVPKMSVRLMYTALLPVALLTMILIIVVQSASVYRGQRPERQVAALLPTLAATPTPAPQLTRRPLLLESPLAFQLFANSTQFALRGSSDTVQYSMLASIMSQDGSVTGYFYSSGHVGSQDQSQWPPSAGGTATVNAKPYDLTFYENYGVNPFIDTEDDHFSTFAMDVDTASYTVMRRYLRDGHLPDKDAVRVEEFINYFRQDYEPPADPRTAFAIHLEGAPAPFGGEKYHLLRVGLQGYQVPAEQRKDASLVFVIDVSGSMAREDRLGLVKRALHLLVGELRPTDTVGIVIYGSRGQVLLEPTPASESETILQAIDRLQPSGSTNAEEGLVLAYQMASQNFKPGGINRVVLCSDGVANVGRTGSESILKQIQGYADQGITLSTVGFGMGNYNDVLMEQLADDGDGNYAYVDTISEARRVFVENLTGTLQAIAKDAKVQVEFNPEVVSRYRLLGYENRDVADEDFRNDEVDAGEVGVGHSVTALYEIKFHPGERDASSPEAQGQALTVYVRYEDPDTGEVIEISRAFDRSEFRASLEETSPRFRLSAAVAEFAEILRQSYWAKDGDLESVLALAREVAEELPGDPDVAELVTLIAQASDLW